MGAIVDFIVGLFQFVIFVAIVLAVIAFIGYNKLRSFSEAIKEAWSNIGVAGGKQASLVNQLIDVVKGYQESEKFIMLKVSEDMTDAANVAQMHQQAGTVLSSVNGLADKFPELKANQQYLRLIDSIQACESQLEAARARYNRTVKEYNTVRSSIPTVFYAPILGFKAAPYLEFEGNSQKMDVNSLRSFSNDDDAERLNALLGKAGNKLMEVSNKTIEAGKNAAHKAIESGKMLAEKVQEKSGEEQATPASASAFCPNCGAALLAEAAFCSGCGSKVTA